MSDLISVVNGYSSYNIKNSAVQNPVTTENKAQFVNEDKTTDTKNTKAIIAGGAVLAAAAATGIYLVMRGRAQKAKQLQEEFQKQFAKFENGKAVANSGEDFSGEITKELQDGSKVVLNYQNGVLKQSSKINGENKVFTKVYEYDKSGKLTKITDGREYYPTVYLQKYKNEMGFDVVRGKSGEYYINKETNEVLQYINRKNEKTHVKYFKDGKLKYEEADGVKTLYKQDGKTPDIITYDGRDFIDENGIKYSQKKGSDYIRRPDGGSSSYEWVVVTGKQINNTNKKFPKRCLSAEVNHSPALDSAFSIINPYSLKMPDAKHKRIYAGWTTGKNCPPKGPNGKRDIGSISISFEDNPKTFFHVSERDGKILIDSDSKNGHQQILSSFDPKTNTFDTLTVPEEQAREIMDWAKKAIEQLKKDRKDFLKGSNKINKFWKTHDITKNIYHAREV